jgi:phosphoribosylpyrophosphate synthetase
VSHLPELAGCKERHEFTKAYYARNQRIVDDSDLVVAFTEKDRGGTWDTIKRARRAGLPVKIIRPSLFFPGDGGEKEAEPKAPEAPAGSEATEEETGGRQRGKGPFHLKRVSLGSFALKLKRYMDPVDWADFINVKEDDPVACGEMMLTDFVEFFEKNDRFGKIQAITAAPRSIRNLDKEHPMDVVCRELSKIIDVPFVQVSEPWDKRRRGRFAAHPEIKVTKAVRGILGKVVFVLDDVSTTNYTLRMAVKALMALEIHAHGVCWVQYA